MTKEEYQEIVSQIDSEDLEEKLRAIILLSIFPQEDVKYKVTEINKIAENVGKSFYKLKEEHILE